MKFVGENAEAIQWEIVDMAHKELPEAQTYWNYLYSGNKQASEQGDRTKSNKEIIEEESLVGFGLGSSCIYKIGAFVKVPTRANAVARRFVPAKTEPSSRLSADGVHETGALYVPAELLAAAFNITVEYKNPGDAVCYEFPDGRRIELFADSTLVRDSGEYKALQKPCAVISGSFYVPVKEFCADILGKYVSAAEDVVCVSDHYAVLGRYSAGTLRRRLPGTH